MREQASYKMLQNQLSYYDGLAREAELVNVVYNIPKHDIDATMQKKAESHVTAEFFRWQWEYLRVQEMIFSDEDMPIAGFRREWQRANFGLHWQGQKHIFHPRFVSFIENYTVAGDQT